MFNAITPLCYNWNLILHVYGWAEQNDLLIKWFYKTFNFIMYFADSCKRGKSWF